MTDTIDDGLGGGDDRANDTLDGGLGGGDRPNDTLDALLKDVAAAPAVHTAGDHDLLVGHTLGRFVVTARLGKGGMGVVYRAHDPGLRRDVALKVLPRDASQDPDRRARFMREARAAAGLTHAHIAAIYDVGFDETEQLAFIAMELIEGEDLRTRLHRGPLPLAQVEQIARQVARGLARAHAEGVVHRDLKPDNIMITRDGDAKILDFGLAKHLDPARKEGASTVAGTVMGTPGYMAPEQVRAERVDARADVFAFGVVLYELLAGKAPFTGPTPMATALSTTVDTPAPLVRPDAPALVALVGRCLEKDRERRPRDGQALVDALTSPAPTTAAPAPEAAPTSTPTPTAPPPTPASAPPSEIAPPPTSRAGLIAAGVVVVVVVLVALVALLR